METNDVKEVELCCVIVNKGTGSKVLKIAKQYGIKGGTIFFGRGTVKNRLLEFLEVYDIRKEIVLMAAEKTIAYNALEHLYNELHFAKPNHGIAFSTSIKRLCGTRCNKFESVQEIHERSVENKMYNAIFAIVDKGKAEEAIEAATKAGSKGGTIINARGSGIHETSKLFSMDIEPEKEIVLILSEEENTDKIVSSINESLKIDEPGNGIVFVQDVNKTYGLY
jgi:nitrogen regulatory protein PII